MNARLERRYAKNVVVVSSLSTTEVRYEQARTMVNAASVLGLSAGCPPAGNSEAG